MHRTGPPTTRELRRFGLSFGSGLTVIGSLLLWKSKAPGPWILSVAAAVILSAVVYPRVLQPLEWLLAKIFVAVTTAVTYIVLTLAFFLVITPIGLLMRLTGKDSMLLRSKKSDSYWSPVEPNGPSTRPDQPY